MKNGTHNANVFWGVNRFLKEIKRLKWRMTHMFNRHPRYHLYNLEVSLVSMEKHFHILRKKIELLKKQMEKYKLLNYYICEDCDRMRYKATSPNPPASSDAP